MLTAIIMYLHFNGKFGPFPEIGYVTGFFDLVIFQIIYYFFTGEFFGEQ